MLILGNGILIFYSYLVNTTFFRKAFVYNHEDITVIQLVVLYFLEDSLYELSKNSRISVNNCNANTLSKQSPVGVLKNFAKC